MTPHLLYAGSLRSAVELAGRQGMTRGDIVEGLIAHIGKQIAEIARFEPGQDLDTLVEVMRHKLDQAVAHFTPPRPRLPPKEPA